MFIATLGLGVTLSSGADTVSGRITYLDLGAHRLMLDNSDLYAVAPDRATGLEVGRLVTVEVATRGTVRLITKVDEYT
jgi:hypothetical protein